MPEEAKMEEQPASGNGPVQVTARRDTDNGSMDSLEIVKSLEAAKDKVQSGLFGRDERKAITKHLEQAKFLVMRQLEWEASQTQFMQLVSNIHNETLASRDEAQSLRGQAVDLHTTIQERQAKLEALEAKLLSEISRVNALEQREKTIAQRETSIDRQHGELHDSLESARREVLGLMEKVKEDVSRIAALEAREHAVSEREDLLDKKDRHLSKLESEVSEVLQKNMALNVKFEEFNASMVKRLEEAAAWEARLEDRERLLENREKAVEAWKLDLSNREGEYNAKLEEIFELNRQKEHLQVEMAQLREQRLAEIEQSRKEMQEREVTLQRREKEASALARALAERNIKLVERKQHLDAFEAKLNDREKELGELRRELTDREAKIQVLEGRIQTLEQSRKDLIKSLNKIRGEI